ncbi:MAG TPA: NusG domain II-containing protein [Bacillota bacterium]
MTALDRKLIAGLLIVAAILFLGRFLPATQSGLVARVELTGRLVKTINLTRAEGRKVVIELPRGRAELEIKNRAVRIVEMPDELCPRKICSHSGWIRKPGEMLICVPNRLVVRLVSTQSRPVDAITR